LSLRNKKRSYTDAFDSENQHSFCGAADDDMAVEGLAMGGEQRFSCTQQ